ncbi:MAG: LptF/LptG family permease [Desulfobacteraceae bacterium]|jgi:lipopolysaccharide export system permease protein
MLRTTLIKYISKEIWAIFLTCLLVLFFIVMASQVLNKIGLLVNTGAGFGEFFRLILYLVPKFILYSLPAACLMAVLLSFIRMASDNEIIALHSSGISLYQLMPPVLFFSLICFLFACFLTLFCAPYGNRTYESARINMMKGAELFIKEGEFIDKESFVFYVRSNSPKDRVMKDVFIVYKRKEEEKTITAKQARFKFIGDELLIELTDYKMFTEGKDGETRIAESKGSTDLLFPLGNILGKSDNKIEMDGMYFKELSEFINNSNEDIKTKNIAKLTLYEMFSIPMAVFIIGITGAPLGAQIRAHGRTKGIIISLILFLSYYIIFASARYLCENGKIDPVIGVWLPVLYLLIISVFLLIRSARDLSMGILDRLILSNAS